MEVFSQNRIQPRR